jgi:2-oxoacid dehydrogenases acyltransferase (catalytic domain)
MARRSSALAPSTCGMAIWLENLACRAGMTSPPLEAQLYPGPDRIAEAMTLSLTVDHRGVDGAPAARFLAAVADRLQVPATLL